MNLRFPVFAGLLLCAGALAGGSPPHAATQPATQPVPLIHAHAHNDYLHERPLLELTDALSDRLIEGGAAPPEGLVERLAAELAVLQAPAA